MALLLIPTDVVQQKGSCMTISSSLNAGVAGLSTNATRLATISDNIANASTIGYKRVTTDFQSLVNSSGGGSYSAGGVRAMTQRLVDESASLLTTSNATDLAVRGGGFVPVASAAQVNAENGDPQMRLMATGSFRPDSEGYLTTASGMILLGWAANPDGTIPLQPRDTSDGLEPVQINDSQVISSPTTQITLGVNLPAEESAPGAAGTPQSLSIEYFDNLGSSEAVDLMFTPTGTSNEWTMTLSDSASGGAVIGEYTLSFTDSRTGGGTLDSVTTVSGGAFDPASGTIVVSVAGGPIEVDIGIPGEPGRMTQLADTFTPMVISKDGAAPGNMIGVEVDANGFVRAQFDTGVNQVIYQIPLVDVANPNGMISMDSQTFLPSAQSGAFFLWDAGTGPTGEYVSYALEESATDVAGELTAMIQTQRAYSSNAKVIQTVDEMLQETTNIKR
jgi:flagellar hook protein FlgE